MNVSIDVETSSPLKLRQVGAAKYHDDPRTVVTAICWSVDGGPVKTWLWGDPDPWELASMARQPFVNPTGEEIWPLFHAWGATFERLAWHGPMRRQFELWQPLPIERWRCTQTQSLFWGVAPRLDVAGQILHARVRKDTAGTMLMRRMALPEKDGSWLYRTSRPHLARLGAYCALDVQTEQDIARRLPALPDATQREWEADQRVNDRGLLLDQELIYKMKLLAVSRQKLMHGEMTVLSGGEVKSTSDLIGLKKVLAREGYPHDSLARGLLVERLPLAQGLEAQLIQLRLDAARATPAKLDAMLRARCADGRVRHSTSFYRAHTGRSSGTGAGVQPQNLMRPKKEVEGHIPDIVAAILNDEQDIGEDYGVDDMTAMSSAIRSCITAPEGSVLISADYSQIEARMLAWFAGQNDILDVFRQPEGDVYVHTAKQIGSDSRLLGKTLVLACGYQCGWRKYQATAKGYGLELSDTVAERTLYAWRAANHHIVDLWARAQRAAMDVALARGPAAHQVGKLRFERRGRAMLLWLPSGRPLVYRDIRVRQGEKGQSLVYSGYAQGRWHDDINLYGGALANHFTQGAARDLLFHAMLDAEDWGVKVHLTVHDELVAEAKESEAREDEATLLTSMRNLPTWALGLPVQAAAKTSSRYGK